MRRLIFATFCAAILAVLSASVAVSQNADGGLGGPDPNRPVGLTVNTDRVQDGYILIPIVQSKEVLLLSNDGRIVHKWDTGYYTSNSVYLNEEGNLIKASSPDEVPFAPNGIFGFAGGLIEVVNWDSEVVWSFEYMDERNVPHHDIEVMPNGNILILVYERFFEEEVLEAGRNPELMPRSGELWSEKIIEVDPNTNEIVWEWRAWDHLVQDINPDGANYGVIRENPQLININFLWNPGSQEDWLHMNSVDYNPELDQIMLGVRNFNELWVIDHGISTEEATGEAGDLLYRWGNPEAHGAGGPQDQLMFGQHDPKWITEGLPGEGNVLVYDNGDPERPYSRVIELALPMNEDGTYTMNTDLRVPVGKPEIVWQYSSVPPYDFYSRIISGAERQPNGNTLIAEGARSRIFEVTPDLEIVWEYYLPPASYAFRAERYDPSIFEGLDLSGDLEFVGGIIWGRDCVNGVQPRLHEWIIPERDSMNAFIETHGEAAQVVWETEACAEHGGFAE